MKNNIEKKKKKVNKKVLSFVLVGVLALALVSALTYYALFSVSVSVTQPITVIGDGSVDIGCLSGETCIGKVITIKNFGDLKDREVSILVTSSSNNLTTGVAGELLMSKKSLVDWTLIEGDQRTVKYSIVGEVFKVWDIPDNYVAVYYPNKNTYDFYDGVVVLDKDVEGNLPMDTDLNKDNDEYCTNGLNPTGVNCYGAKLWLVPTSALTGNVINWGQASMFYFETDLITYTDNILGTTTIVVPAGGSVNVYPQVTIDKYAPNGSYPIEVKVL